MRFENVERRNNNGVVKKISEIRVKGNLGRGRPVKKKANS